MCFSGLETLIFTLEFGNNWVYQISRQSIPKFLKIIEYLYKTYICFFYSDTPLISCPEVTDLLNPVTVIMSMKVLSQDIMGFINGTFMATLGAIMGNLFSRHGL